MIPLSLIKLFGPYVIGALLLAGLAGLILDRNHLANLNTAHQACLAAVKGSPNAKPLVQVCEPPVAAAVTQAAASAACNTALASGDTFAASQACAGPTKTLIADRDSQATEVANLNDQLSAATADRDAAVARAQARAQATSQGLTHATSVFAQAPHDSDGLSVCDAVCLRALDGAATAP